MPKLKWGVKRPGIRADLRMIYSLTILFLCVGGVFALLISVTLPQQFDLQVGDIVLQNITATKSVVDQISTDKLIEHARSGVKAVTVREDAITQDIMDRLSEAITVTTNARNTYSTYKQRQIQIAQANNPDLPLPEVVPDVSLIERLRNELGDIADGLSDDDIRAVITVSDALFVYLRESITKIMSDELEEGIRDDELEQCVGDMLDRLISQVRAVDATLQAYTREVIMTLTRPNVFYDEQATQAARDLAEAEVEPVIYKKGQNIVRNGEPVQENQLQMLVALGLIRGNVSADLPLYIGMAGLLLLLGSTLIIYMFHFEKDSLYSPKGSALITAIVFLTLGTEFGMRQIDPYLMPVHLAVMIAAVLLSPRLALGLNLLMGVCAGVLATGDDGIFSPIMLEVMLITQIGGFIAIYTLRRIPRRTTIMFAGLWAGLTGAATVMAVGVMTNTDLRQTGINALLASAGGLLSAIATVGFLPVFESAFSLTTSQKLLELSNPNQPLLRQLQIEAPGTYHHALLVANLAEAAADAIGANALLARVGAYYHDVGKLKRPQFFKENQLDDVNPHDDMQPEVSSAILAAHVRDGRQLGEKHKLPGPILDIIQEHHGTSIMGYFFHRAKVAAQENGTEVNESDYRYDGPRPQSREAAVIALADTVEAAVRSMKDHSSDAVQGMIHRLVQERIQSGEMDEVELTLKDFDRIEHAFRLVLGGIYHKRIEYPDDIYKNQKKKENEG